MEGTDAMRGAPERLQGGQAATVRRIVETLVLERFSPSHVVVTRDGEVVHFSTRTADYLELPSGPPTRQLVALARRELKPDVGSALREAVEDGRAVTRQAVLFTRPNGDRRLVQIVVEPLEGAPTDEPLLAVLFMDVGPADRDPDREVVADQGRATVVAGHDVLANDLRAAQDALALSEAQLTRLRTVEQGLEARIETLAQQNRELLDLIESAQLATVVLDQERRIASFTRTMSTVFDIRPQDQGRPMSDLTGRIALAGLDDAIETVLSTLQPVDHIAFDGSRNARFVVRLTLVPGLDRAAAGVALTFIDITRLTRGQAQQQPVIAELNHRVKNMLTVVIGLAQQTFEHASRPQAFLEAFTGRLQSMAQAHDLVSHSHWGGTSLGQLVQSALGPFDSSRVTLDGPEISLRPDLALSFGMMLYELVTNAARFGALSAPGGAIAIGWNTAGQGDLAFHWRETDGPALELPERRGFGLKLIEREITYNLGGRADLNLRPTGFEARITVPLERRR